MKKLVLIIALATGFIACQSPQEKSMEQIKLLELQLVEEYEGMVDLELGQKMISGYINFATEFSTDSNAALCLFKAGEVAQGIGEYEHSLELFAQMKDSYPKHEKAPVALFLTGFITDNHLNSPEAAKLAYQEFINNYPNHPLAKDARILIEQAGLDDIRIIREFQN
ncbi:MAG: tetratricopeptide (TPR) repeat protein [Flavobacteriales bacterium]|jgi:tetratricopeptide (TPR) repeat protein